MALGLKAAEFSPRCGENAWRAGRAVDCGGLIARRIVCPRCMPELTRQFSVQQREEVTTYGYYPL